jgi:hypothetical protein
MSITLTRIPLKTRIDDADKEFLSSAGPGWRLSLYLPFTKSWREPLEDKILLRDLRREARASLENHFASSVEQEAILASIDALLAEPDASRLAGEGMALFAAEGKVMGVLLPFAPAPSVLVDRRFRLHGILPQLFGRDRYYLLKLSQHDIRLWDCDGVAMIPVSLAGLDTDIRTTPHFQDAQRQVGLHTNSAGHHGLGRGDVAHSGAGPGNGKDSKSEIETFFRQIDHGIQSRMPVPGLPLLLAGVEYLMPIYRKVNTYRDLLPSEIPGNPEASGSMADLHVRANALMSERERAERNHAMGTYVENLSRARSCAGYTDTVPCAVQGRLTHLFVEDGPIHWGTYEPETGRTTDWDVYRDGAEELANLACIHAYHGRARIYAFAAGELPSAAGIAGLFRT